MENNQSLKGKHALDSATNPDPKRAKTTTKIVASPSDVENLLEDSTSPIYEHETPLKLILNHPLALRTLDKMKGGNKLKGADVNALNSAVAAFKEDGRAGFHDEAWVIEATAATALRRFGAFDEMEESEFGRNWATSSQELSDNDGEDVKSHPKGQKRKKL